MKTYRQELQTMINKLDEVYDMAEYMRDASGYGIYEGKDHMNMVRKFTSQIISQLRTLDNNMPQWLADSEV